MPSPRDELTSYLRFVTLERGLSAHTVAAYERDLSAYIAWLEARDVAAFAAVTPVLVTEYLAERSSHVPTPAATTLARVHSSIRGLHRFVLREGRAAKDPTAKVAAPKTPRKLPDTLTLEQVQRLLEAPPADTPEGLRDRALLELLYATGARVSEAISLDVDDVAHGDVLRLRGKGSKERVVPLGSYARDAIEAYLTRARPIFSARGKATPKLFLGARGASLSRQSAWLVLQSAAERAQLTAKISPHTLRHCFATHLLQGGADVRVVQELLGHASVATTQIYTHVNIETLREVFASSHPRAREVA